MPKLDNSELLALWLDGALSGAQRNEFETRCAEDSDFASQVEAANLMQMQSETYESQEVPDWHKDKTFDPEFYRDSNFNQREPAKRSWWQWQGLPAMSLGTSMLAIVMVLSGLQINTDNEAVTISFSKGYDSNKIEQLVNNKLQQYQQNQQLALNTFAQTLQRQQLDASTQLTQYLLTSSRQERKEDFAELIKFVNQQRGDDQLFYARQLNKLQQDIYDADKPLEWPSPSNDTLINE